MSIRIGVDLGGTKIEAVALDGTREVARRRIETPRNDYRATLEAVASLVESLERHVYSSAERSACPNPSPGVPVTSPMLPSVGVGIPGTLSSATGLVKNANSVWLIGRPLLADLTERIGRDVRIANDANCFAVSEAADGAGEGADVVFGVIVGTGTGAGVVVRGQVLTGPNGIAGEWGHNPLPWPSHGESPGPACYCGRHGCIETFLSGPGLQADDERRTGRRRAPVELVADAAAGEPTAQAVLARYEERMARALASVINLLDPDVIVLGGGLSNMRSLYERVPRLWGPYVFSDTVRTRLMPARHGDASGVRGAAWLWP